MESSSPWHTIANTAASEFSDISDLPQATRLIVRLALAALLGDLLGWERESSGKAAGVRTHMLVAMGSALFVMLALQTGAQPNESSRVMQGVIAGIGFLGAGTILKETTQGDGLPQERGLTTAAGIWLTAARRGLRFGRRGHCGTERVHRLGHSECSPFATGQTRAQAAA